MPNTAVCSSIKYTETLFFVGGASHPQQKLYLTRLHTAICPVLCLILDNGADIYLNDRLGIQISESYAHQFISKINGRYKLKNICKLFKLERRLFIKNTYEVLSPYKHIEFIG